MTPESELNGKLITRWVKAGYSHFRMPASCYASGYPDHLLIKHGRHVWVECKVPPNKLSPRQVKRFTEMAKAGAQIMVIDHESEWHLVNQEKSNWTRYF